MTANNKQCKNEDFGGHVVADFRLKHQASTVLYYRKQLIAHTGLIYLFRTQRVKAKSHVIKMANSEEQANKASEMFSIERSEFDRLQVILMSILLFQN